MRTKKDRSKILFLLLTKLTKGLYQFRVFFFYLLLFKFHNVLQMVSFYDNIQTYRLSLEIQILAVKATYLRRCKYYREIH